MSVFTLASNQARQFPVKEIEDFKQQLNQIAEEKFGGKVADELSENMSIEQRLSRYADKLSAITYSEASKLPGEEIVRDLLERTILWADIMSVRQGKLDPRFKDKFDYLNGIRSQLGKLSLTQAWSLRETDLFSYQRKLDRVDEARVDGNFLDDNGQAAELYEQRTLLYLLRKSYATIYYMLTSSEPVSEALQPIYNQLNTLRRCLVEVKRSGGVNTSREMYPYSMKLHSIENMREDGKFVVNGEIPEGQASIIALLNECFQINSELRMEADLREEEAEKGGDKSDNEDEESPIEMRHMTPSQNADGSDTGLTRTVSVR